MSSRVFGRKQHLSGVYLSPLLLASYVTGGVLFTVQVSAMFVCNPFFSAFVSLCFICHMFCRRIGPRSFVWAEESVVDKAAYEFVEVSIATRSSFFSFFSFRCYDS